MLEFVHLEVFLEHAVPEKIAGDDHDAVSQWNAVKEYAATASISTKKLIRRDLMD